MQITITVINNDTFIARIVEPTVLIILATKPSQYTNDRWRKKSLTHRHTTVCTVCTLYTGESLFSCAHREWINCCYVGPKCTCAVSTNLTNWEKRATTKINEKCITNDAVIRHLSVGLHGKRVRCFDDTMTLEVHRKFRAQLLVRYLCVCVCDFLPHYGWYMGRRHRHHCRHQQTATINDDNECDAILIA